MILTLRSGYTSFSNPPDPMYDRVNRVTQLRGHMIMTPCSSDPVYDRVNRVRYHIYDVRFIDANLRHPCPLAPRKPAPNTSPLQPPETPRLRNIRLAPLKPHPANSSPRTRIPAPHQRLRHLVLPPRR